MSGYPGEEPTRDNRGAPNPEDMLEQVMADFASHASILEAEARDFEDRMLACRARAAAMRTGVGGLQAALERYATELAKAKEFQHDRDDRDTQSEPTSTSRKKWADQAREDMRTPSGY